MAVAVCEDSATGTDWGCDSAIDVQTEVTFGALKHTFSCLGDVIL